ncbi:HEAT repeat domain-containing protein [Clostridium paridis]|uniref:HEAT repeat domain-containing protein n=1 Tax=Clostridium paridis TaxID=2803863 RepID=A0A937K3J8_9CLOT|nr:HEAT repeat domain-containing protein [Clostridium paridis]MBL4931707.1 HEAT repeat domain-containing protein [Clostridium paridis]
MRSSDEQLKNRGYVESKEIENYLSLNKDELLELLKSKEAYKRTIAIKLFRSIYGLEKDTIYLFCEMLEDEKKLYTKLEICEALSQGSIEAAKIMVNYLGRIGNNQYRELPAKKFNKKSYPLPRDIIARTLSHMGIEILPELINVLKSNYVLSIREAIDAIGFICFYNNVSENSALEELILVLEKYREDEIIRWKIVRALESFKTEKTLKILKDIMESDSNEIIRNEAKRSLDIINNYKR